MNFYTIKKSDVGRPWLKAFGRVWMVSDFLGRIMNQDVGKRIYKTSGDVLQVENKEQFIARKGG